MTYEELERGMLFNSLANMGEYFKLKMFVNPIKLEKDLAQFENNWCPYSPSWGQRPPGQNEDTHSTRWGLPITSHTGDVMDNYHLKSFGGMQQYHNIEMKEENFATPTQVYHALPQIQPVVDMFQPDIGRVHFLKLDAGGYFPPHVDFVGACPEYIRLITVFGKCKPENFVQMLGGVPTYFDPGYFYFVNFQREHSVFSFTNHVYSMILTVKLNQRTHDLIVQNQINS